MDNQILQSQTVRIEPRKSMVSFKDCPNQCVDGFIVDPYIHKKLVCPYCEEKRKELVFQRGTAENADISKLLNIDKSFIGITFDADSVIPNYAKKVITPASLTRVTEAMEDLLAKASVGELPEYSILFNFGAKCNEMNFLYPLLTRYYLAGVSLTPLLSCIDIALLRNSIDNQYMGYEDPTELTYMDLIKRDLCVINIDAGATKSNIGAVKGLMQLRARQRKPTIIVTNVWGTNIKALYGDIDDYSYHIARLHTIENIYEPDDEKNDINLPQQNRGLSGKPLPPSQMTSAQFNSILKSF